MGRVRCDRYNACMVAVLHAAPETGAPQAVAAWLDGLRGTYPDDDLDSFKAAFAYAREHCADAPGQDGEPLIDRAAGTATILAGLKLDAATVRAALLVGLPAARAFDQDDVAARFGPDVAALVAGVARMDEIRALPATGDEEERAAQAERLRKMLLAMVDDIRVVLVKLAERTQALRYAVADKEGPVEARQRTAREVLDLFAPLANRLGIWQLKWELEDLSLRALEPETYKSIARMLDERRLDRQRYIEDVGRQPEARACRGGHQGRRHRPPQAHLQHLEQDAAQAVRHRGHVRHPGGARSSSTTSRTATRRWASSITCGRRCRASSTTTSRNRRRTTTARCTPR